MLISEKSADMSASCSPWRREMRRTLSVHEVADGNRVAALGLGGLAVEHVVGMAVGADTHVLLAELLDLALDGNGSLCRLQSAMV